MNLNSNLQFCVMLLCALTVVGRADTEFDKPAALQEIHFESLIHSLYSANCGWSTEKQWTKSWDSMGGPSGAGAGYFDKLNRYNSCEAARYGYSWQRYYQYFPNGTSGTMTYSRSDGAFGYSEPCSFEGITLEKCDVIDTIYGDNGAIDDWDRVAYTTVKLHTGGKASSTRSQLFTLTGSAVEILSKRTRNLDNGSWGDYVTIPANQITMYNGPLGGDSLKYVTIADNSVVDITPTTSRGYYAFTHGATKHKLKLYANNVVLFEAPPAVTKYCVGEKVVLAWEFVPPVPGITSLIPNWEVTANFVNNLNVWPYTYNSQYLDVNSPSLWWVRGGQNESATLGLSLSFANGMNVVVTGIGYVNVYVPQLVFNAITTPGGRVDFDGGQVILDRMGMAFSGRIVSEYSGTARISQLIRSDMTTDVLPFYWRTHGEWWSDNGDPYTSGQILAHSNGWPLPPFQDSPSMGFQNSVSLDFDYKAYVRFAPDRPDSIYITLGRVDWDWTCNAVRSPRADYTFCNPPVATEDSSFPVATGVLHNAGTYP